MRKPAVLAALVVAAGLVPALSGAHPEHPTLFPSVAEAKNGKVPKYRRTGPYLVVCRPDSARRINRIFGRRGKAHDRQIALLRKCRHHSIQGAVNHARSGYRIEILPGVYKEEASRRVPIGAYGQPPCANDYVTTEGFTKIAGPPLGPTSNDPPVRPDRNYMVECPNSKYLIVINGDPRKEPFPPAPKNAPRCLQLCNLQIEGTGRKPTDVTIIGDRKKVDVIRADRANGIYLRNFAVEQAWFNDVDLVEVDGFVVKDIVARYAQDYGILSFTAVNGLYDHDIAYGNGDSGLYPGSTMKGCDVANPNAYGSCASTGCQRYSIEIRNSESYGNSLGYSGTAGNSTWVHDNKFHDNATGMSTDSAVAGHPGFPQECFKWEHNEIYSNNYFELFELKHLQECADTPFEKRPRTTVCPQFGEPSGSGVFMAGTNRNLLRDNYIYDNWRSGVYSFYVPALVRNDTDPSHQTDNSDGNHYVDNKMGHAPDGSFQPNGVDFTWDGQGIGNCWQGNATSGEGRVTNNIAGLPGCGGGGSSSPVPTNLGMVADSLACSTWDPKTQLNPPACTWFTPVQKP